MAGDTMFKGVLGWTLIALGFFAPFLTAMLVSANYGSAGYTAGRGFLISIAVVIYTVFAVRRSTPKGRGRIILVAGIVILAVNLWFCVAIAEEAEIDREVAASKLERDRINQAATAEITAINSLQLDGQESTGWQRYATPEGTIDLGDEAIPLRERLIEMTRRARARDVDSARAMRLAVDESGLAFALDPNRLLDPQGRAESLQGLARYRTFIDSYEDRTREMGEVAGAEIKSLKLPKASEQEALAGLKRREQDNAPRLMAMLAGERTVIDQIESLVRFVDMHGSSAYVVDGALKFPDAADQAEFDRMILELEAAEPTQ